MLHKDIVNYFQYLNTALYCMSLVFLVRTDIFFRELNFNVRYHLYFSTALLAEL
jgi:hypothetical protein